MTPARYDQLTELIHEIRPETICEVGTWNAANAVKMCRAALEHRDDVFYQGFDVFEEGNADLNIREFNVKKAATLGNATMMLESLKERFNGFHYKLTVGDTRATMRPSKFDFAWIDGGHSIATIKSDYENLKTSRLIALDDYYYPQDGKPDIQLYGCNRLIDALLIAGEKVTFCSVKDALPSGGFVGMVVLRNL